ncbi:MAG: hypothetical protein JOY57_09640 [Actinobacteria bacterium]|nr:hypothetical protein [Actinomycetota bacterium]
MATATEELSHDASDAELEKLFEEFPVSGVPGHPRPQVDPAIAAMKGRAFTPFTVVLWVVVAALLGGSAAALITHKAKPPSAPKLLARAAAFVKAHPSAALSGDMRIEAADSPGSSSSAVFRFHVDGVAKMPGRARIIATAGESDGADEAITVDGRHFERQADSKDALAKEKYAEIKPDDTAGRTGVVGQRNLLEDADLLSAPNRIGDVLSAAETPVVVSRAKGVNVVKASLSASKAYGSLAGSIKEATLTLTALNDGTVQRTVVNLKNSEANITIEYQWSKWGDSVVIEAPSANEIDATPDIEEEKVAAFKDAPLFQPQALPTGWVLTGASVLSADETAENCPEVEVDYGDPSSQDTGYLTIYQLAATCADPTAPPGSSAFVAGPYRGFVSSDQGETDAQFLAGRTVVQVQSDLSPAQLSQVMAHLVPLNLAKAPLPLSGLGTGTSA